VVLDETFQKKISSLIEKTLKTNEIKSPELAVGIRANNKTNAIAIIITGFISYSPPNPNCSPIKPSTGIALKTAMSL